MKAKLPGIAEFSELGDFLNLPLRCYSAGMVMRLAFAIATSCEPDVLLIDEVFSTGDLAFQQKAEARMKDLIHRANVVIMVSHNLSFLEEFANRVLWLEHGRVRADGPPEPAGQTGHAYMKARMAEEQRRRVEQRRGERLADELDAPLVGLSSERTRRVLARPEVPLTAAYLVPRAHLDAFRREVQRLGATRPDVRVLCTGPWPPYHFVPSLVGPPEENRA